MIVLIAAAIVSGLATAAILAPVSALAAMIIAPLAASASAILACIFIAWRNTRDDVGPPDLEAVPDQTARHGEHAVVDGLIRRVISQPPADRVTGDGIGADCFEVR